MEEKFKDIKFKYPFRDYQEDTLKMLSNYMNDKKIHVVAPPGAGKTILALELMLRLGNKALILVPTIVIKEQWIERLKKDFINGDKKDLISNDIENPKVVTVDTYQGLYALDKKDIKVHEILKNNNINTIILDEAHHLRRKWQNTLMKITDLVDTLKIVSLTATPPYDNETDYNNYIKLCGNIDAKITVPQLVKSKCLCPHQDYIYFNTPDMIEEKEISILRNKINMFIKKLVNSDFFIKSIALHEYVVDPDNNISDILDNFDFFIAILSFLKEKELLVNPDLNKIKLPEFNIDMLSIIIENFLFNENQIELKVFEDEFKDLKKELTNLGCIDKNNKVSLKYSKKITDLLTKNYEKLNSICDIIKIEKENLKDKLKLVIVTDFIKDEYVYSDMNEIKELGIVPIFKKIINNESLNISTVVLTGTLIIIPTRLKDEFLNLAEFEYKINKDEIEISELGIDFNYSKVELKDKFDRYRVNLVTKFFHKYDIDCLIGTIALIGEGWDAPFINSLIMATYTSSFVTSNQLRGRAIRIDKNVPNKFANIWHLICLEQVNNDSYDLGYDYDILSKRFIAYDGIDFKNNNISTGIRRLNIENKLYTKNDINLLNKSMIEHSKQRLNNISVWKEALKNYTPISKNEIKVSDREKTLFNYIESKSLKQQNTEVLLKNSIIAIIISIMSAPFIDLYGFISIMSLAGVLSGGNMISNYMATTSKNYIKNVVNACFKLMKKEKLISNNTTVFINFNKDKLEYGLKNASTYEQMLFLKAIKEALSLEEDTRYLAIFNNHIARVPKLFDKNKDTANEFIKSISGFNKKLIYTKSEKGKDILLKSKLKVLETLKLNDFDKLLDI